MLIRTCCNVLGSELIFYIVIFYSTTFTNAFFFFFSTYDSCDNEAECQSAGQCNDWEFSDWTRDMEGSPNRGVCVVQMSDDNEGKFANCNGASLRYTRDMTKCINTTITDQTECEEAGHEWNRKAFTQQQCEAHGTGCREPRHGGLTAKNESVCAECGGMSQFQYIWTPGNWRSGTWKPTNWLPRAYSPVNSIKPSLDDFKLEMLMRKAIGRIIGREMANRYAVTFNFTLNLISKAACDCTGNTGRDGCFNGEETRAICVANPGTAAACGDVSLSSDTSNGQVAFGIVQTSTNPSQFVREGNNNNAPTRRRLGRRTANTIVDVSDYDVVVLGGYIVGRLLGNGVGISMDVAPSGAFSVCVTIDDTLLVGLNETWVYDFGQIIDNLVEPLNFTLELTGDQLCANVTELGTYFPIARVDVIEGDLSYLEVYVPDAPINNGGTTTTTTTTTAAPTATPTIDNAAASNSGFGLWEMMLHASLFFFAWFN